MDVNEIRKNQILDLEIEGYSSEGVGIAHTGGRAVFVPGTIPGECWEALILKAPATGPVYAKALRCRKESAERIPADCPNYGRCGGCDTRHMSYREELRFKLDRVNAALKHIGRQSVMAEEILPSLDTDRYRNKAIFAVGNEGFGFFRPRSHQIIPVEDCLLQSQLSIRCARTVVRFMSSVGVEAYDEQTGRGRIRHVFCRQARSGSDAVCCVVSAGGLGDKTALLVKMLREACPELTGIVLNINKTKGNTVLAGDFYTLWGRATILDTLCGLTFEIAPQAFFQINPPQAERLYRKAVEYAVEEQPDLVFDLYCGAGTISLCLAQSARRVIGAEIVSQAVENARENARRNGVENVEFLCADAYEAARTLAERGERPAVVVVDPPRKGMSREAVEAVASMAPERVVYVSCDPATLARDILHFQGLGFSLQRVTAVDMFPRTCHVESVALLLRDR